MKREDRSSWLKPRASATFAGSKRGWKRAVVAKKAGPREVGRVGSDEWTPAEFAAQVKKAMQEEDRTSWLEPRLSNTSSGTSSKRSSLKVLKKAGPREIGRLDSDEWTP